MKIILFNLFFFIRVLSARISDDCEIISKDGDYCLGEYEDDDDLLDIRQGIFSNCKSGHKLDQKGRCRKIIRRRSASR